MRDANMFGLLLKEQISKSGHTIDDLKDILDGITQPTADDVFKICLILQLSPEVFGYAHFDTNASKIKIIRSLTLEDAEVAVDSLRAKYDAACTAVMALSDIWEHKPVQDLIPPVVSADIEHSFSKLHDSLARLVGNPKSANVRQSFNSLLKQYILLTDNKDLLWLFV